MYKILLITEESLKSIQYTSEMDLRIKKLEEAVMTNLEKRSTGTESGRHKKHESTIIATDDADQNIVNQNKLKRNIDHLNDYYKVSAKKSKTLCNDTC